MKRLLPFLLSMALVAHAVAPPNYVLQFTYPTIGASDTNVSFYVYYSPVLSTNLSSFQLVTNFPATSQTNTVGTNTLYQVPVFPTPPASFYYVVPSNSFWGMSTTSVVAGTPPVSLAITSASLVRQ